jgi:hypothetical protein
LAGRRRAVNYYEQFFLIKKIRWIPVAATTLSIAGASVYLARRQRAVLRFKGASENP